MAETLRYPLTKLESSDDYLRITALEYKAPGFKFSQGGFNLPTAGDPNDVITPLDYFILPIPEDISDQNATGWGETYLNPLEAGVAGAIRDLMGLDISNLESTAQSAIQQLNKGSTQKFLQAFTIAKGTNFLLGGNLKTNDVLSRYSGAITNSNIELIFSSVSLRQPFSFSFDMVPRSQKEAETIRQIIRKFKKYSAAKKQGVGTGSGLFLKAPEVFKLQYMSGKKEHPYLNRFKICALRGMSVNYTGSGTYATYADGAPVHMQLTLSFQELTPIYAEDYDKGIGAEGTGF